MRAHCRRFVKLTQVVWSGKGSSYRYAHTGTDIAKAVGPGRASGVAGIYVRYSAETVIIDIRY